MNPDKRSNPLPLFPLKEVVLFPGTVLPLHIFEPRYRQMVEDVKDTHRLIGMVLLLEDDGEDEGDGGGGCGGVPPVARVGCAGRIVEIEELADGRYNLKVAGMQKFEILAETGRKPYRTARVLWVPDINAEAEGRSARAAISRVLSCLDELAILRGEPSLSGRAPQDMGPLGAAVHNLINLSRLDPERRQELLELKDVYARARRVVKLLEARIAACRRTESYRRLLPEDPGVN